MTSTLRTLLDRVEQGEGADIMAAFKRMTIKPPALTRRESIERTHAGRPALKALGRPCHDCAVTCGFYELHAEELAQEDEAFQDHIAERWFCHNHPGRACAGVRGYLDRAKIAQEERT